jgi:hypothetical protein
MMFPCKFTPVRTTVNSITRKFNDYLSHIYHKNSQFAQIPIFVVESIGSDRYFAQLCRSLTDRSPTLADVTLTVLITDG